MTSSPSALINLFSAYNARQLNPKEVAASFVPSKKFWTLLEPNNSLLIGPRGSGKTTLLKMLQPEALGTWQHPEYIQNRVEVQFFGVFVPTDLNWKEEISVAIEALKEEEKTTLMEALFVANIQLAFVTTLIQISVNLNDASFQSSKIELDNEASIVKSLIKIWQFSAEEILTYSFKSLRRCLRHRIRLLSSYRPNLPDKKAALDVIHATLKKSQFGFEQTIIEAVEIVEDEISTASRWALCFDEVELAPEFIQAALFKRLRSPNEKLIYKLAVAPFVPAANLLNQAGMPAVSNDWTPIQLWYTNHSESQQRDAQKFCLELWKQIALKDRSIQLEPSLIFGESQIEKKSLASRQQRYTKGSLWQGIFAELYAIDSTFRNYLKRKDIDPENLDAAPPKKRDAILRKIAPLVQYRLRLIRQTNSTGVTTLNTSRNLPEIYSGWGAICAICEGNPRWFKSIVDTLLKEWSTNNRVLSKEYQARELQNTANRFRSLIAAFPVGEQIEHTFSDMGPETLISLIAEFQQAHLLRRPFSADPPLSIELNKSDSTQLKNLVAACLNVGALISVDDSAALSLAEVGGRRFRLSYLLAPSFLLPLRSGKAVTLNTLLASVQDQKKSKTSKRRQALKKINQASLWKDNI